MKFFCVFGTIIFLSIMATISAFSQNYEISITLNSRKDTVYLGHYFAKRNLTIVDDTVVLKKGKGVFRGKKKLANGVYFIVSDGKIFDIIMGDNQKFGITADTADFINLTKFDSSPENDVFFMFQRDNIARQKQAQQLGEQFQNASSDDEKIEIRTKMQNLTKERLEFLEKTIDENSNLFVSKFIKAIIPPETYVPEPPRDDEGNVTDREFQYRWYRAHFFDNLNIFDPDMLRTPFYEDKLLEFITRVIPQITDTVCVEIDKILTKTKSNDEMFRCVLVSLFNHYANSMSKVIIDKGVVPENVWVHLSEKWYIPYSWWSTEEYIEETLKKEVTNRSPNLIGKKAPPIEMLMVLPPEHFKAAALDTAIKNDLHAGRMIEDFRKELKNRFTALFFWEYSCGHCKKVILEMYELWEESKDKGLDVITIQTVISKDAKVKSIDYINEHNLFGWTNAWSPYSYIYKELYNITGTPAIYLLDENGMIFLRNVGIENLKEFFNPQQAASQ